MQPFRTILMLIALRLRTGLTGDLLRDRQGMGAVEFALIVPVLLIAYLGAFELSVGFTVSRKVSQASSSIADILTAKEQVSKSDLDGMKYVVRSVMTPFAVSTFTLKMTGIQVTAENRGTVLWSRDGIGGTPYVKGSIITITAPASMIGTNLVRSELTIPHQITLFPTTGPSNISTINIQKTFLYRQRVGKTLPCTDCG